MRLAAGPPQSITCQAVSKVGLIQGEEGTASPGEQGVGRNSTCSRSGVQPTPTADHRQAAADGTSQRLNERGLEGKPAVIWGGHGRGREHSRRLARGPRILWRLAVTHMALRSSVPGCVDGRGYSLNTTLINTKKHAGFTHKQPAPKPKRKAFPAGETVPASPGPSVLPPLLPSALPLAWPGSHVLCDEPAPGCGWRPMVGREGSCPNFPDGLCPPRWLPYPQRPQSSIHTVE